MKRKEQKLITVFASGKHALIALAKSILDDAKIEYFSKNEQIMDLIAGGALSGYNPAIGPMELMVLEENAEEAKSLLKDLPEA